MLNLRRGIVQFAAVLIVLGLWTFAIAMPISTPTSNVVAKGAPGSTSAPSTNEPAGRPAGSDAADSYVAATPMPAAAGAEITTSPAAEATPVTMTPDHPFCGVGLTAVEVAGGDVPMSCVHNVLDPVPGRGPGQGAVRKQPKCLGDGVSGPRVQFLYVYAQGQPNRAAEYVPHMLQSWIPAMEGAFRSTSAAQGREIGMRVHMPNCRIEIGVVQISAANATPDNPGAMRGRIEQAVRAAGYTGSNRKYHAWFDGANMGACGVAPVIPFRGVGDNPTPLNPNNLGSTPVLNAMPQVAVSFKLPFPLKPGQRDPGPICWGNGGMGALTEIHELLHLMGSVSNSAPNSNGLAHCRDEEDIMCYSEGGIETFRRCGTEIEALDCGADDYFNSRPQVGSYLSYNWNIANSKFLGTAIEDSIPITLPRP